MRTSGRPAGIRAERRARTRGSGSRSLGRPATTSRPQAARYGPASRCHMDRNVPPAARPEKVRGLATVLAMASPAQPDDLQPSPVDAVVFDLGNVLIRWDPHP